MIYKVLGLGDLKPTSVRLVIVDSSPIDLVGIVGDMVIKVA